MFSTDSPDSAFPSIRIYFYGSVGGNRRVRVKSSILIFEMICVIIQ